MAGDPDDHLGRVIEDLTELSGPAAQHTLSTARDEVRYEPASVGRAGN